MGCPLAFIWYPSFFNAHYFKEKNFKSASIFLLGKKQLKDGVRGKCSRSLLIDVSNKAGPGNNEHFKFWKASKFPQFANLPWKYCSKSDFSDTLLTSNYKNLTCNWSQLQPFWQGLIADNDLSAVNSPATIVLNGEPSSRLSLNRSANLCCWLIKSSSQLFAIIFHELITSLLES